MSVKIVQKPLPAGTVPYEEIADPTVKQKVMLLNRNIASLAAQLAEVQRAAIELQQRPMPKQKEIADIERYVAQAAASAESAAGSAKSAGTSATNAGESATSASGSATSAGTSATNAGTSATAANEAKLAAESARDAAVPAAQTATQKAQEASAYAERAEAAALMSEWSIGFVLSHNAGLQIGLTSSASDMSFPVSAFVPNEDAEYDITVTFRYFAVTSITTGLRWFYFNGSTYTRIATQDNPITRGTSCSITKTLNGSDSISVVNGAQQENVASGTAQWDVMVFIKKHQTI